MPMNENYGGPLRQGVRGVADSEVAAWVDPLSLFTGPPTPQVDYREGPYQAFNEAKTREALGHMRAQGPSPAELKTRAAMDSQARALAMRGQTASGPLGAQQALAGGADAQRTAIMAGAQQRAVEEQNKQVAILEALEGERARQFAASRAGNQRRFDTEKVQREMFNRASKQDFERISKQLAMLSNFTGNAYNKALTQGSLGQHTPLPAAPTGDPHALFPEAAFGRMGDRTGGIDL